MPRSRTEAMLSGCCVISTGGQDAEMFIESGVDGIIVPRNTQFVVELIESMLFDYKKALAIGKKGREKASEVFTLEKFHQNWGEVIKDVTGKEI